MKKEKMETMETEMRKKGELIGVTGWAQLDRVFNRKRGGL